MKTEPRVDGAVRLAATSGSARGETIEALALEFEEVVAGTRRLDLATLAERPPKPLANPARVKLVLEEHERILARNDEQGVAVTSIESARGCEVRIHALRTRRTSALAVDQPKALAAAISLDGKCVIVLHEGGRVLCYDIKAPSYPDSASAREPPAGKRASIDLARGSRLWLAAAGTSIEVRMMSDVKPVAAIELPELGNEVTCAMFLPDVSGFLVGTAEGVVMRYELLVDRVGTSREAQLAAIADGVDAAIAGTTWTRYEPRVDVYDERTENGRTTLYFVADHYEYHQAQSGSDWAEHYLCSGHATFEGDRCLEVLIAWADQTRLTEKQDESYDAAAELAARRVIAARTRSSSTLVPGGDAIKRAFDPYFASYGLSLPEICLHQGAGKFGQNGWDVRYRFGTAHGIPYLDIHATHRMTNDRLYRISADGLVELVGSSTEGVLAEADQKFFAEVRQRFG